MQGGFTSLERWSALACLRGLALLLVAHALGSCAVAVNEPAAQPFDQSVFNGTSAGVYLRVVDVGSALCVVAATSDGKHFVYDAGGEDRACLQAIREIVGDADIDLLVISHSDVAHMQDVPELLEEFAVGEIWWAAIRRPQPSFRKTRRAISAAQAAGTRVRKLGDDSLVPGTTFSLGDARVTFVAGGARWPGNAELEEDQVAKAVSLVVRLDYGDASVLLPGDILGRTASAPDDACDFAEAELVKNAAKVPLQADVLLAPNHGRNTASSRCLIEAVQPGWVIFPSGHQDAEPRQAVARRYLDQGIPAERLLRTDRGDDEGDAEWDYQRSRDCRDQPGDDDVEILMPSSGRPTVRYLHPRDVCIVLR